MMHKFLWLPIALVIFVLACTSEVPDDDLPGITPQEAIANVQTLMKNIKPTQFSNQTCYGRIGSWRSARAEYIGQGEWAVSVSNWRWSYFEGSGAVLTKNAPYDC